MSTVLSLTIAGLAAMTIPASTDRAPLRLTVDESAEAVRFQVVAASAVECEASYVLDVRAGGNHSVQKGRTVVRPGAQVTLLTSSVRNPSEWKARLTVNSCSGKAYEQTETSRR